MNPEQVVRDFLAATESDNPAAGAAYLADNMVFMGGMLPQPGGAKEVAQIGNTLREAFSDFRWNIQHVWAQGNQVAVKMAWGGIHTGALKLGYFVGVAGAPAVLPTGKLIRVPEKFMFTVKEGKITRIQVVSASHEGYVSLLRQVSGEVKTADVARSNSR